MNKKIKKIFPVLKDLESEIWQEEIADVIPLDNKKKILKCNNKIPTNFLAYNRSSIQETPELGFNLLCFEKSPYLKKVSDIKREKVIRVDNILDLHNYSLNEAYRLFKEFIIISHKVGHKVVMVITGKGNNSKSYNQTIRYEFSSWLKDSEICPKVSTFAMAKSNKGGEGAYYIFLKHKKSK